ncbi:papain-like cysteine protease family protein [Paracidovorax citrulli]|uniref:papain-like cysteine protease family protein n=1 Tax=Paracidovorax citrulli TaxID=80869 RepID=UPI0006624EB0|nr:papain-like cysteine protease family protein [Paracidovorax citrulli]QCX10884.1 Cysteine protease avirulence protein AvrRpt2 [Paracidovorax citrulli]UEG46142.1 C39 family peptidase [Paracidovorax citrulli]UMT86565.1 cysteine protease [Paracidovorax citrulli]UMT94608.1 cysteine protease [Paracidovorax citrulli]WIY34600.1 papain-like cysteine protease family protein [Paracidovorax citrulli]
MHITHAVAHHRNMNAAREGGAAVQAPAARAKSASHGNAMPLTPGRKNLAEAQAPGIRPRKGILDIAAGKPRTLGGGHFQSAGSSSSSGGCKLVVPYIPQNGTRGCWEATMNMLRAYFGQPPLDKGQLAYLYDAEGVPKELNGPLDYATRNRKAKLKNIPVPAGKSWDADKIRALLDQHGPLEARIESPNDELVAHAIVLTGIDEDGDVICHDPELGPGQKVSIAMLNAAFDWSSHRMALTAYGG